MEKPIAKKAARIYSRLTTAEVPESGSLEVWEPWSVAVEVSSESPAVWESGCSEVIISRGVLSLES